MNNEAPQSDPAAHRRERAESIIRDSAGLPLELDAHPSSEDIQKIIHELRVHQIELEMQNEELRATQNALEKSRERFVDLYDFAPVGYLTIDERGMITEANITSASLLGISRGALIKHPLGRFVSPDDQNAFYQHRRRLVETGNVQAWEMRMVKSGGIHFWTQIEAAAMPDTGGARAFRIIISDITERKRAEEELRTDIAYRKKAEDLFLQSEERLRAERMRTRIASDLHDDIGSTLSSTAIFCALIARETESSSPRIRELVGRVEQNLREIQVSLHDIVWSANPGNDTVGNVLLKLREHAEEAFEGESITLKFDAPPAGEPARIPIGSRREIFLTFKETIHNVIKHAGASAVSVTISLEEKRLALRVTDNGKGFNPEEVMQGNGVANMKRRIESLQGIFHIDSAPGAGTSILVNIPID